MKKCNKEQGFAGFLALKHDTLSQRFNQKSSLLLLIHFNEIMIE
jgi:hypothetical protein